MDDFRNLRKRDEAFNEEKPGEVAQTARKELDRLLDERPEFRAFQEEVERRLEKAGNPLNRLAVLGIMIEEKLRDLQENLSCFVPQRKSNH